jgi:hypothetical protein
MKTNGKPIIHIASAPVSWGVMEETETSVWPSPEQVLEEISTAGYDGTELGLAVGELVEVRGGQAVEDDGNDRGAGARRARIWPWT